MTKARILSAIANRWCMNTDKLAQQLNLSRATVVKHCRALQAAGFVFCEDDYEGRARKGGRYAHALWCMNCEISGLTIEQAQQAMQTQAAAASNGADVLCDMGLGC